MRYIGKEIRKVDAEEKVSGRAKYQGDVKIPGMLHGKAVRAEYPHARVISVDTREAKAVSGGQSCRGRGEVAVGGDRGERGEGSRDDRLATGSGNSLYGRPVAAFGSRPPQAATAETKSQELPPRASEFCGCGRGVLAPDIIAWGPGDPGVLPVSL